MELCDKLAIVTGASRGIGRALSRTLAERGCGLLLTALEKEELKALSNELQRFPVEVATMPADLSIPQERGRLVNWVLGYKAAPDILVNNAGTGGRFGRFEGLDVGTIEKTVSCNISAFLHLTHDLIPSLKSRPRAKIVNISSGIARLPYPGLAVYGATKAFVSSLTESLTCELDGTPVDVLCFHPTFTMTSFMQSAAMDMHKIPPALVHTPEHTAARIVRAIERDRAWAYSDWSTRVLVWIAAQLPFRLRIALFKDLFWELPDG
jgi:short-subunit dehydrogenase